MATTASSTRPCAPGRRPRSPAWFRISGRAIVILTLVALGAALLLARPLHQWLLQQLAAAETVIRQQQAWGMVVFVLFAAVSAMVAFVSSAVLVPVAVYAWGPWRCAVLLWAGWYLGGLAAYAIGRYLGRPVVRRLVSERSLGRQERWARSRRSLPAIVLVQLAVPSDLAGYVFGMIRCPFLPFVTALAIAEVPYAIGAVYLGVTFVERRLLPLMAVGVAGVLLSLLAAGVIRRQRRGSAGRHHG